MSSLTLSSHNKHKRKKLPVISCPLDKSPRACPLQSSVPNLQLPAVLPAHVPWPTVCSASECRYTNSEITITHLDRFWYVSRPGDEGLSLGLEFRWLRSWPRDLR